MNNITAKITFILPERLSQYHNGNYFVIKLKGDDGVNYDLEPNDKIMDEYVRWQEMNIGDKLYGLMLSHDNGKRRILNNRVFPYKIE